MARSVVWAMRRAPSLGSGRCWGIRADYPMRLVMHHVRKTPRKKTADEERLIAERLEQRASMLRASDYASAVAHAKDREIIVLYGGRPEGDTTLRRAVKATVIARLKKRRVKR